ncbi:MAG: DUF456 domain-containing protein [Desulfatibacillaceae bacterium]|nr:DUF456 domain-containing protein [Desulfatibacillaceae bacterium]
MAYELLVILGFALLVGGFAGSIIPLIPGPALAFGALVVMGIAGAWEPFSIWFYAVMGLLCIVVSLTDNILPLVGAGRFGGSRAGVWGAIAGLVVGIFIAPPWTIFLGAFAGAVAGEYLANLNLRKALYAGWGVFLGSVAAIALKLAYASLALFFFVKALFWG